MNIFYIPSDKQQADNFLKGAKMSLMELLVDFEKFEIEVNSHVSGTILNSIEIINKQLDGGSDE